MSSMPMHSAEMLTMRLLSVAEVAETTGLSESAVYRAIAVGELRASKLRGRLRVRLSDLESWIESNLVSPESERVEKQPARRLSAGSRAGGLRELLRQET
jgi:excisionase family DNA binding protein